MDLGTVFEAADSLGLEGGFDRFVGSHFVA